MSMNLSKGPIWGVAVIVGLIAATVLVAGYVDRPSACPKVAATASAGCPVQGDCAACPESCPAECCCADAAASCPAGAAVMAQTADAGATCPMKAAAATGNCGAGQCPAAK